MKNAYFSTSTSALGVITIYGATIPIYGQSMSRSALTCSCGLWSLWLLKSCIEQLPTEE
jgi:hypothetical protein